MGRASKQQLENVFGTSKDVDVVEQILEKGQMQQGAIKDKFYDTKNDTQAGHNTTSRGSGGGYGGR